MRLDLTRNNARLELRVMELEDAVAAMSRVIAVMTDMLGGLNKIAAHYADTVASMMPLPSVGSSVPPPPSQVPGEFGAGRCNGDCACACEG